MAVTKRTRFEVLRRDGYRCRYCRREDLPLTVDHVLPSALGGSDGAENLVAACKDCNSGKAASSPDASLVDEVKADAERWARAIHYAAEEMLARFDSEQQLVDQIRSTWEAYDGWDRGTLPADYPSKVRRWLALGLPEQILIENIHTTWGRPGVDLYSRFAYFAGICWNQITELQQQAAAAVTQEVPAGWE